MTAREAWIRQEKRVLIDIGFINEENKNIFLTNLGKKFTSISENIDEIKDVYTESIEQIKCFGVYPVLFFKALLPKVENSIDKFEFAYFVQYAREKSDLDLIATLILSIENG